MEIYIKLSSKVEIVSKKEVYLKDIAMIQGATEVIKKVENLKILQIESDVNDNYLISMVDLISIIKSKYEDMVIFSIGETDTIVSYKKSNKKEKKLLTYGKVLMVCLILFCGGAIAIMTFHTDAAVPDVFTEFYFLFLGSDSLKPYVIEIPYSIGLTVGIITFYNHFSKIKLTQDPSPIEVEFNKYTKDVEDTIKEQLTKKKGG